MPRIYLTAYTLQLNVMSVKINPDHIHVDQT